MRTEANHIAYPSTICPQRYKKQLAFTNIPSAFPYSASALFNCPHLFIFYPEVEFMIFEYRLYNIIADELGKQMLGGTA